MAVYTFGTLTTVVAGQTVTLTSYAWQTPAAWTSGGSHPTLGNSGSFVQVPPTDSYVINTGSVTIGQISGGPGNADSALNVTVGSAAVGTVLQIGAGFGYLEVDNTFSMAAGTLQLSSGAGLLMGDDQTGLGGVVALSGGAVITNSGPGVEFITQNSNTQGSGRITGGGTILAAVSGQNLEIGQGIEVVSGDTTAFQIANGAVLEFDDEVLGGNISFLGAGGTLDLGSNASGFALASGNFAGGNTITGVTSGSIFEIQADTASETLSAALSGNTGSAAVLTVTEKSGATTVLTETFNVAAATAGAFNHTSIAATALGGGLYTFNIQPICFAAGTSILTAAGSAAVESIAAGDTVLTLENGQYVPRRVIWTGHRTIDLTRHPRPELAAPIRFRAGALGENQPQRDLLLSPDHALFLDGGLIPAKLLVNGMTIVRDTAARSVAYHHIELEKHAILIAEGVPAESYLDTGNRAFFANAGPAAILYPEFGINEHLRCWEEDACARLTVRPDLVKPVWQRIADRAVAMGYTAPVHATTADAALALTVDGKTLRPLAVRGQTISFVIPEGARDIRLISRAVAPKVLTPWLDDPRVLGVAIRNVTLRDRTGETVLGADHPALVDGWHAPEHAADGAVWRWTTGEAVLPIRAEGACVVEIELSETTTYIDQDRRQAA